MRDGGAVARRSGAVPLGMAVLLSCALVLVGCTQPTGSESSGSSSGQPKRSPVVFVAPDRLAGLPRSEKFASDARETANLMKRYVSDPTSTFGEVYASETSLSDVIQVSAVVGTVTVPGSALDWFFARQQNLQDVRAVDAGPLGGEARCGRSDDEAMVGVYTVCAWADIDKIGALSILSVEKRDRREEFATLRAQVEQAG